MKPLLIPDFVSAGTAIGTLVAEFVVLIVQYAALQEQVTATLLVFYTVMILFRTLLNRDMWANPVSDLIGLWAVPLAA